MTCSHEFLRVIQCLRFLDWLTVKVTSVVIAQRSSFGCGCGFGLKHLLKIALLLTTLTILRVCVLFVFDKLNLLWLHCETVCISFQ